MPPPVRLPLYSPTLEGTADEAVALGARAPGGPAASRVGLEERRAPGVAPEASMQEASMPEGSIPAASIPAASIAEGSRPELGVDLSGADKSGADELMQVGDLARVTGKTVRAIHLYEELQLLRPAGRSKGRYRLYGREALLRIRWIGKLQDMGFSLTDIQTIVKDWEQSGSAPHAMVKVREVYEKKLAETREHLRKLKALEHELEASLDYLDTCDVCDPARLLSACRSCELHGCNTHVPDLIAGFRAN